MAERRPKTPLVLDPGVLDDTPVCELGGFDAVAEVGGIAILPWRHDFLRAEAAAFDALESDAQRRVAPESRALPNASFEQCVVHLQKGRSGTWADLAEAWRLLRPGGRLLLEGGNALGVTSAVKRLAEELDQRPRVLTNRARARIAAFERDAGPGPVRPVPTPIQLPPFAGTAHALLTLPGTFSARQLDPGSGLLLDHLSDVTQGGAAPRRVLDLACGAGPLGLCALQLWPEATAVLTDGDWRAVRSAEENALMLECSERTTVLWRDASERIADEPFDLVLLNPPFHTGKAVDLEPARRLFAAMRDALRPGGRALVVANTTLPYERDLRAFGDVVPVAHARGYKLLSVIKRSRSSSSSGRQPPGSGSAGRS
jgi:16S rRNA (guanine1207-N2)-methyltransferase